MSEERPVVLVAEDEAIASMALRAQLEALDYEVVGPARDGDEALTLGRCFPIDIAIFDQRMPRRTGLEAADQLFREAPTPVLLLTGFSGADLPDPIPRPPIFATLTKPVGLADLRAGLEAAASAFRTWMEADPEAGAAVRRSRSDREIIARAVRREADGRGVVDRASELIRRAGESGASLVDLARRALGESAGP